MEQRLPALVDLHAVTQRYGHGETQFTAIESISLSISEGEFVALLGPSGCGKSTLLRIITGLTRASAGEVRYRGNLLDGVNPAATIVFQSFALFPWLTVLGNVEVALRARNVPAPTSRQRAEQLIDVVGLDGFERAYPRELSGGMRQKVGFARALAVEPELLCLDEPFSALDVLSADALRRELLELWTSGTMTIRAVLLVSHNIEEAVFLADRIVVMEKGPGRIIAEVQVPLPHPRDPKAAEFVAIVDSLYALLMGETGPEHVELGSEPGEAGATRALPHTSVTALSGLLVAANATPDLRDNLYRLRDMLHLDLNALVPVVEAAELLGFAQVAEGELILTPLGETFAEASILARKEIFASRLRRLPLIRWMQRLLSAARAGGLPREVFLEALGREFHPAEAARQLGTALEWARYAELLSYDESTGKVWLEAPPSLIDRQ